MDVKSTLLALLCAAAVCGVHAGQVYKWVDPNGRVHFSDTPQPGWKAVNLDGSQSTDAAPATAESASDEEVDSAPPSETAEATGGTEADASARATLRAEECKRAQEQLESYKKAPRIVERDALGKEKEYSSEERLQLIEQQQKRVRDYCGAQSQ